VPSVALPATRDFSPHVPWIHCWFICGGSVSSRR